MIAAFVYKPTVLEDNCMGPVLHQESKMAFGINRRPLHKINQFQPTIWSGTNTHYLRRNHEDCKNLEFFLSLKKLETMKFLKKKNAIYCEKKF